jgi:hypothetical protein
MLVRKSKYVVAGGAALLGVALAVAAAQWSGNAAVTLPARTPIHVTLDQTISSTQNRPGDHFQATLAEPIVLKKKTIAPAGTRVEGLVVDARKSGRLSGVAVLRVALDSIEVNGKRYEIRTTSTTRVGEGHKKRDLEMIGGGAGGGAVLGAIAGGGKGVLMGGPIGAGAGTVAALLTGRKDIRLAAETPLTFELAEPVRIPAKG